MSIGAIFVTIFMAIIILGDIAYIIYCHIKHKPILKEECAIRLNSKRILKQYHKMKKLETNK